MKQSLISQPLHTPAARLLMGFEQSKLKGNDLEHAMAEALRGLGMEITKAGKLYVGEPSHLAEADFLVGSRGRQYALHVKTSLRERWKLDDRSAMYSQMLGERRDHVLLFWRERASQSVSASIQQATRIQDSCLGDMTVATIRDTHRVDQIFGLIAKGEPTR